MQVSITVNDADVLQMLAAGPERINRALLLGMKDASGYLLRQVRTYPPPPDPIQGTAMVPVRTFTTQHGQSVTLRARNARGKGVTMAKAKSLRYRRTNTLQKSWSIVMRGTGINIVGGVSSSGEKAPYNRYVQDDEFQAQIHQGRWRTVQQIAAASEGNIQNMFEARIRAAVG